MSLARVHTVAFHGTECLDIDVQVRVMPGLVAFNVVGLPDKAVNESRERVRNALQALGLALPAARITVNLAPADVAKEGSHYDLPIALALLGAMDVLPKEEVAEYVALGELSLDGSITNVQGVLPAAIYAAGKNLKFICPAASGPEAAWAGDADSVLAPPHLLGLINHFKGTQVLRPPIASLPVSNDNGPRRDWSEVRGQETAKRALEIAAAGGHNVLMSGPPGSGKSMLAARLPTILPPLTTQEALEVSLIHSLAGTLPEGGLVSTRPYREPHHSASLPALVGGGLRAKPGEISLAHHGVLFLDELPEFQRPALEALRQPIEGGQVTIARANHHVTYPARFQLIAAMNPCKCGYLGDAARSCSKVPRCGVDYQARLSGPILDRIDLHVDVAAISANDLQTAPMGEDSTTVRARVIAARAFAAARYAGETHAPRCNADLQGEQLQTVTALDTEGQKMLGQAVDKFRLSARAYYRVLRVARTLADLAQSEKIQTLHLAEALAYRPLVLTSA